MSAWPSVSYEQYDWDLPAQVAAHLDVFEQHRRSRPYQAALAPEIAELNPERHLSPETLELAHEATAAAIRFDQYAARLPVAMPAVLLRTEAASSSQIENITAGARNLAVAMLGLPAKENAAEVAANTASMTQALTLGRELTEETVLGIHHALMKDAWPEIAGRWRTRQVWIGASSFSPHGADFTAPHHSRLAAAAEDWFRFSNRRDIEPLVLSAVSHAQFETLHPFEDGNGRTGRVLVHTTLRRLGVTAESTVPVSAGLLRSTRRYFEALTAYREGELDPIVQEMANSALSAVQNGRVLGAELGEILSTWEGAIRARRGSAAWRLAEHIFEQPVVDASWAAERLNVSDRTARNAIQSLEEAGVLEQPSTMRRNQVWQATAVIDAMDQFAKRAGRRQL
ncbi:Fic family protein [Nesterenkonia sp. NBAIMH1]|uniref:Fic family protein n=1 Tax=Nesterenkonia sp. NBAIMH1 TaxID=2600320 RepID=UPI0011B567F1|nr:Fic family protein [Nesterenkonia sp. NBAIMH1]